jgi:Ca-activated chloride channel family protein
MKRKISLLAVMLVTAMSISPINSKPKYVIAVLDFREATGSAAYKYLQIAVPEIFATNLAQATEITVLERDRVKKILKEAGLIMAGVTRGNEKKIGKLLAAKQLLSGTIIKTGTQLRIDVRLTDVSTGRIIVADKRRCTDMDEIIDAVDLLSEKIVEKVTGKKIVFSKDIEPAIPPRIAGELVEMELLSQNTYCKANSEEPFFVRVGFYAKEVKRKKERLPLNISIVLDRSGSMSNEDKLDYAKKAIEFIIKNLTNRDTVSVVVYDDRVDVIVPPTKAVEKDKITALIKEVEPGGSTNLSGGMLEGFNQVKKSYQSGQVNRVLLISDGLANVGITEPKQIQKMAGQRTREGITISTFGVGKYFNEKLLTGIAEYGSANYYYIDQSEKIPEIFSRELEGLLAVVAQNCTVQVIPRSGASVEHVYGYNFDTIGEGVVIKLGDLVSEEKKLALIRLQPPKRRAGSLRLAWVQFSYDDAISDKGRVQNERSVSVSYTESPSLISKNVNSVVMKDAEIHISSMMMERAIDLVDRGKIDDARKVINENLDRVRSGLVKYRSKEMKKQALNIVEYQQNLERAEKEGGMRGESFLHMQKKSRADQYDMRKKR